MNVPQDCKPKNRKAEDMTIEIKVLTSEDEALVLNVAEDVFDDPVIPASARAFLADPCHRLVAALDGGKIVGFISAVIYLHPDKPAPELWINEVGVAGSHQGQGIGKRLMRETLADGKRAGCREAWVLTEQDNTAALALYQSAGGEQEKPNPVLFTFGL
jgi:aminoglycoside 6'-N-acetyltransferase I